eukprot:7391981-Prymnesium_polylepis.2
MDACSIEASPMLRACAILCRHQACTSRRRATPEAHAPEETGASCSAPTFFINLRYAERSWLPWPKLDGHQARPRQILCTVTKRLRPY